MINHLHDDHDRMPLKQLLLIITYTCIHKDYTDDLDLISVAKYFVERHDRTKYFGK